jgi:hypothetical protein
LCRVLSPGLIAVRRALVALWGAGLVFTALAYLGGLIDTRLGLFLATLVVECAAVVVAFAGRRRLAVGDPGRRAWTWIGVALALRLLAELRLATLYLDLVPGFILDTGLWDIYFFGLRYLYTLSDLALLPALLAIRRDLQSTGLDFHLRPRDALVLVLLPPLPVTVHLLQSALATGPVDAGIHTFRLVGATVGMVVSGVCVVLASPALQMGGGAWAWIWGAAAAAGIARGLAFAAAAVAPSLPDSLILEQALLWTFACGWLLATSLHLRLISGRR